MKFLHKLVLSVASAAFFIASAQAQTGGTVANHAVAIGKGPGISSQGSAAPGTAGRPLTSNGASSDPSFQVLPNAGIAPGAANTLKGSLDGATTSDIAIASCSAIYQFTQWISGTGWQCGINPVLPSRAVAAGLNLSAFTAVRTLGYATPGDGGGATFVAAGATPFSDTYITAVSINAAGSGCTNGTYLGVYLTGGSGRGAKASITVAGNIVTAVTITTPNNGYAVNDDLGQGASFSCGGSNPDIKVTAISTPTGSFTDNVGTRFQYVTAGPVNVKQFGAKLDYTAAGGDAAATNDKTAIQNALYAAGDSLGTWDAGGYAGRVAFIPAGVAKVCGGLLVPVGVTLMGAGPVSGSLKQCDSDAATVHFITLGDPIAHLACFGTSIREIELFTGSGAANSNIAMIYTNCAQQNEVVHNVTVYAGARNCLFGDTGYGGAANFIANGLFCTVYSTTTNAGIQVTYGAAAISLKNVIVEAGAAATTNGIQIVSAGIFDIDGLHCENISTCVFSNVTAGSAIVRIHSVTGGANCTNLVTRQGGSHVNAIVAGALTPNGCTTTINNAGTPTAGNVVADTVF